MSESPRTSGPQFRADRAAMVVHSYSPAALWFDDFTRAKGVPLDRAALTRPSTNIEVGQRHLEALRDGGIFAFGLSEKNRIDQFETV